mmetsp:Transcript_10711/g.26459  ORF Transcript_10711/g.26459 Transcript_10711/m.26459 type:complete len:276 (+) Transcript_10711:53-880(+)
MGNNICGGPPSDTANELPEDRYLDFYQFNHHFSISKPWFRHIEGSELLQEGSYAARHPQDCVHCKYRDSELDWIDRDITRLEEEFQDLMRKIPPGSAARQSWDTWIAALVVTWEQDAPVCSRACLPATRCRCCPAKEDLVRSRIKGLQKQAFYVERAIVFHRLRANLVEEAVATADKPRKRAAQGTRHRGEDKENATPRGPRALSSRAPVAAACARFEVYEDPCEDPGPGKEAGLGKATSLTPPRETKRPFQPSRGRCNSENIMKAEAGKSSFLV